MPAATRRHAWSAGSGLVVALLLGACSALSPASSPPAPVVTPGSLPPAATGRPLQPVPEVRPAGFADPPPGTGLQRYRGQPLVWRACAGGLQCTTVLAPLDYDHPDGPALTLALTRRPATAGDRLGTLFINPGGPGGSGQAYVGYFDARGLERYDVVGWDARGVGASTPVRCYGAADLDRFLSVDVSPDDPAEERRLVAETYAFGQSCLARSGALLEHISTETTVRDLDLLRTLVGDERLSYFGASYGTRVGALYAQLFPATVGRLVLDGAVDISGQPVSQLEGFERALRHFAAWSVSDADADAGRPLGATQQQALDRIKALLQHLDAQPLAATGGRVVSQQQGVEAVIHPLYSRASWPALQASLAAAERGDGRGLLALADAGNYRSPTGGYSQINDAFPAVRCLDSRAHSVAAARREADRLARLAPVLGPFAGVDLVCPLWPVAPAPKAPRITGKGAAPILVLGNTGDPATPYENAVGMARQLDSGVLVTLEGEGHTAYGQSRCVQDLVRAYLVRDEVPADGTRCTS